jgi:nicotinamidase-related amidase
MNATRTALPPAAARPLRALPGDYLLPPGRTALVVVDMQRDHLEPGGLWAAQGADVALLQTALEPTLALLRAWRERNWPVVFTREAHAADLHDCPPAKRLRSTPALRIGDAGPLGRVMVRGEGGCDVVPPLAPRPGETVLDKPGKGGFHATLLHSVLQSEGVTHLVLAGVCTELAVQSTLREANDRGYDCLLVEDATASTQAQWKAATLEMVAAPMPAPGAALGWVATLADVLAALPPSLEASIRAATQSPAVLPAVPFPPLRKPG